MCWQEGNSIFLVPSGPLSYFLFKQLRHAVSLIVIKLHREFFKRSLIFFLILCKMPYQLQVTKEQEMGAVV